MKPPPFDYSDPVSTAEALALLAEYGSAAKILAGGQSLVPLLNFRIARPRVLIDINRIAELSHVTESDGGLHIGALARQRTLETSALVRARCPLLSYATSFIGHVTIRNRGTFGGSLAHADPAAELPLVLMALGARLHLRSARAERTLAPQEFFQNYLTTALEPTEILVEAWVPALGPGTGWGFRELALLHGAFALVAAAAVVQLDEQGRCRDVRLALGGVAPTPIRAAQAEAVLTGEKPRAASIAEAARRAAGATDPTNDIHASADYRRAMAAVFARRALEDACRRAQGEN